MTNKFLKVNKDLLTIGLSPIEILVLSQIMEFNTNTGDCFISNQTMAAQFGVSEKTISRTVAGLEGKGLINRNTKNVQKGKERHMVADMGKIEAEVEKSAKDKMTLANQSNKSTKDNLSLAEKTICPLRNGQNDPIKDNSNKINEEDKEEIDEMSSASLRTVSSISIAGPEYQEVSKREMIALGVPYEVIDEEKSIYKIKATNKIVRAV